jgi:hypothetical protein
VNLEAMGKYGKMGLEAAKMGSEASSRVDRSFIGCW